MNGFPDILRFVLHHLRARTIPQRTIALETGVPFSTLSKICTGAIPDPGVRHLQSLADYFMTVIDGADIWDGQAADDGPAIAEAA